MCSAFSLESSSQDKSQGQRSFFLEPRSNRMCTYSHTNRYCIIGYTKKKRFVNCQGFCWTSYTDRMYPYNISGCIGSLLDMWQINEQDFFMAALDSQDNFFNRCFKSCYLSFIKFSGLAYPVCLFINSVPYWWIWYWYNNMTSYILSLPTTSTVCMLYGKYVSAKNIHM